MRAPTTGTAIQTAPALATLTAAARGPLSRVAARSDTDWADAGQMAAATRPGGERHEGTSSGTGRG